MNNIFQYNIQLTRTLHDGTVECLIQFVDEAPAWIPVRTIEAIHRYIHENRK